MKQIVYDHFFAVAQLVMSLRLTHLVSLYRQIDKWSDVARFDIVHFGAVHFGIVQSGVPSVGVGAAASVARPVGDLPKSLASQY